MKIVTIKPDHHVLHKYQKLKKYHNDFIILESEKVITYALKIGIKLIEIVTNNDFLDKYPNLESEVIYVLDKKELKGFIGYNSHSGTFALAKKPEPSNSYHNRTLILDKLTSPENVGSICRSAKAFGFNTIIYNTKGISPHLRRCIRVSTGHILGLNIVPCTNLIELTKQMKKDNFEIVSAHNSESSIDINNYIPKYDKIAIIVGSEGHGISNELIQESDIEIKISTHKSVEHLNVANASSIIMSQLKII